MIEASGLDGSASSSPPTAATATTSSSAAPATTFCSAALATTCCIGGGGIDVLDGGPGDDIEIQSLVAQSPVLLPQHDLFV